MFSFVDVIHTSLYINTPQAKNPAGFFKVFQRLTEMYNRKFVFWSGSMRPVITLVHPETVKSILKSTEPKTTALGAGYKLIEEWIGMEIYTWCQCIQRVKHSHQKICSYRFISLYYIRTLTKSMGDVLSA